MTSGPLFSHPAAGDRPPAALTRQALIEQERQRRLALIEARATGSSPTARNPPAQDNPQTPQQTDSTQPHPGSAPAPRPQDRRLPDGFTSETAWQAAQQAARAVAAAAQAAGYPAPHLETQTPDTTAHQLAQYIVSAVLPLPPLTAVQTLLQAGTWLEALLTPRHAARARTLLGSDRAYKPARYSSPPDNENDEADAAWQRYADYTRLTQYGHVTAEAQQKLLRYLPLSVIDDLIDDGHIAARAVPPHGDRRLYLQARLTPSEVSTEDLRNLGWTDELTRREFRLRLARGDIAVLDEAQHLTDAQRQLAADLIQVHSTGRIPTELSAQKWLWPALERLAPQAQIHLRRDKAFGSWYVVRRMHRALRAAHRMQLSKDYKRADSLLKHAQNDANALREIWTPGSWEAKNILAYLLVLNGSGDETYDKALELISPTAPGQGPREDQLPGTGRANLEHNRGVLRQLQRHREDDHVLNPYLVLDAPDGAPNQVWKDKWRALRRALDEDGEAAVNQAKDAIQARERGRAPIEPFVLPLMPSKWAAPLAEAAPVRAGTPQMPRRSAPPTQQEQDYARDQAARTIIRAACQNAGLPATAEACPTPVSESGNE
ncbi:hypothetical protein OHO83_09210 [Streptomyces sp. NBC_00569]|uniref:hypothetical protein n=1 Tax=Streptomyces sp. NBC_00569 TaxID=2975780 RepID=UPI002E814D2B|nr:hypothetical protein [Streptomyces sp. NBC_00569]WUB92475.1 hypothetical protein OHO83_09210 [Streptomyces sp. NBC_00569]